MTTLNAITEDLLALDAILDDLGGDVTGHEDVVAGWIEELTGNLRAKAESYASLISELENRAAYRKGEATRLAERAKIDQRKADWLRRMLRDAMQASGDRVIETDRYRLSVQANGGKAPLDLHDVVPTDWCKVEVVQTPDKARIREALEAGEDLPFAALMERGTRVVIR